MLRSRLRFALDEDDVDDDIWEGKEGREEGRQEEGTEEERSGQMKGGSRAEWLPLVCALDVLIHINHHFYQLDSKDLFSNAFQQNSICLLCSTTYFQASLCSRSIMHTLCSPGSYHFISAVSVCLSVVCRLFLWSTIIRSISEKRLPPN